MKKFYRYKAIDSKGKVQKGEISAMTYSEASLKIKDMKLAVINLEEINSTERSVESMSKQRVYKLKLKELNIFCKQMETMISSGINLTKALTIYSQQETKVRIRNVLEEMTKWIQKGYNLSQSMRLTGGSFPPLLITMIESGEKTGKIDEVLARMADHYEKEIKISAKLKNAMIYPIILSVVTIVAIAIIMMFVIPVFSDMFTNAGMELPLITRWVMGVSDFFKNFWWAIIITIILLVVMFLNYRRSKSGREAIDSFKLNFGLIKRQMINIYTARFTRTLSSLLSSGVSLADSLGAAAKTANNVIIESKIDEMYAGVRKGKTMNVLLNSMGIFPKMMISMIAVGEETGQLDNMLNKTADYYDSEIENSIDKLLALVEPVMIVVMGIIIGLLVVAIMLPIFQAAKTVR